MTPNTTAQAQASKNDKKVSLKVEKAGSPSFQETYNVENKVEVVRKDAAKHFGTTEADLAQFDMYMEHADGRPRETMQATNKLEAYAPKDGDRVVFEARNQPLG